VAKRRCQAETFQNLLRGRNNDAPVAKTAPKLEATGGSQPHPNWACATNVTKPKHSRSLRPVACPSPSQSVAAAKSRAEEVGVGEEAGSSVRRHGVLTDPKGWIYRVISSGLCYGETQLVSVSAGIRRLGEKGNRVTHVQNSCAWRVASNERKSKDKSGKEPLDRRRVLFRGASNLRSHCPRSSRARTLNALQVYYNICPRIITSQGESSRHQVLGSLPPRAVCAAFFSLFARGSPVSMNEHKNRSYRSFAIIGPTASGKSALGVKLRKLRRRSGHLLLTQL